MKIMFICTGNICRSAMADAMLKYKIKDTDLENKIEVYSAGTYAETGAYATYNAIEAMDELGVDLRLHRATNILDSNIQDMDLILCATQNHRDFIISMYPDLINKTFTIKEYADYDTETGIDIPDPWGYDLTVYRKCASVLDTCLDKIIERLKSENSK